METGTEVIITKRPLCDWCAANGYTVEAHYDFKSVGGPWGYGCQDHFDCFGIGLGTGLGQRLVLAHCST